jgi:hypothetical protein
VETFELSAQTSTVVGTTGRLIRRFPGPAIAIPNARVKDRTFQKALTHCLMSLEEEALDDAIGKGCGQHKDTVHPYFATEYLPGMLRGIGSPLDIPRIHKRTRDDVVWGGGEEPWRRSPRWMLLRVAMQTSLSSRGGDHKRYKIFMIYFMATVLDMAVHQDFPSDLLHVMLGKINRRIQKLGLIIPDDAPWAEQIQDFITDTSKPLGLLPLLIKLHFIYSNRL